MGDKFWNSSRNDSVEPEYESPKLPKHQQRHARNREAYRAVGWLAAASLRHIMDEMAISTLTSTVAPSVVRRLQSSADAAAQNLDAKILHWLNRVSVFGDISSRKNENPKETEARQLGIKGHGMPPAARPAKSGNNLLGVAAKSGREHDRAT